MFSKLILAVILVLGFASASYASPTKGKTIFLKYYKRSCEKVGSQISTIYTQAEWKKLYESGKFVEALKKECPKVESFDEKHLPDLFDFFHEYAKDSKEKIEC